MKSLTCRNGSLGGVAWIGIIGFSLGLIMPSASRAGVPAKERLAQVSLEGGKNAQGTLASLAVVKIKTDSGVLEIEVPTIQSITFSKEGDSIVAAQGTIRGKILTEEFKIRTDLGVLTLERDKLRTIVFHREPEPKPEKPAVVPPKRDVPADNELRPLAEVPTGVSPSSLILSPDRRWLYFLNSPEGKVQRVDVVKRTLDSSFAEVTAGAEGLCLSPNGKTLYVHASPAGHIHGGNGKPEVGKIQIIDPVTMKVQSTFAIAIDPFTMAANDGGQLFVAGGSNQWTAIDIVDVNKQAVIGKIDRVRHRSIMRMSPDQRRLYWASTDVSPGNIHAALLPSPPVAADPQEIERLIQHLGNVQFEERSAAKKRLEEIGETALPALRKAENSDDAEVRRSVKDLIERAEQRIKGEVATYPSPYHGEYPLGGPFEIAADGKHIITAKGIVLHAGKELGEDLKFVGKVEPHTASAMDKKASFLLAATAKNTLHLYSCPDFKLQKTFVIGTPIHQMIFDSTEGLLYCSVDAPKNRDGKPGNHLYIYDLKKILPGK